MDIADSRTKGQDQRRLYQQVADQIRDLISAQEFLPASRLPPERELAQRLGVSRPSLREALIALEIDGSVEIRMGSGVYVSSRPIGNARTRSLGESPSELMQARAAIEGSTIILAAARMNEAALDALRQILGDMGRAIEAGRSPLEYDRSFHRIIAGQSGNSLLARMVTELFDERHSPISAQIRVKFEDESSWPFALKEHEAILAALENKDPLQAQAAMHIHLARSRQRWIGD